MKIIWMAGQMLELTVGGLGDELEQSSPFGLVVDCPTQPPSVTLMVYVPAGSNWGFLHIWIREVRYAWRAMGIVSYFEKTLL